MTGPIRNYRERGLRLRSILTVGMAVAVLGGPAGAERITRFDGTTLKADVLAIDGERVTFTNDASASMPLDHLWKIECAQPAASVSGLVERVLLDRGDIPAANTTLRDGVCRFEWAGGREAAIPRASVRALLLDAGVAALARDAIARALEKTNAEDQVVAVGQANAVLTINGSVKTVSDKAIDMQYEGQDRTLGRSKVGAVVFGGTGISARISAALPWKVTAAGGARVEGSDARLADGRLTLAVGAGKLDMPWSALQRLEHRGKGAHFLSQMDPVHATGGAVVTLALPWQRDRSAMNLPLRLRGELCETGLGTHAPSELVFEVPEGAQRFMATVGLDEDYGRKGDCVVSVQIDDRDAFRRRLRGTDDPVPVSLEVRGGQRLTLRVDPGENYDMGDHVNWYEARLLTGP